MPNLTPQLQLQRCPYCNVDTPSLFQQWRGETRDQAAQNLRRWILYCCSRCGGLVIAASAAFDHPIQEYYPKASTIPDDLPERAARYLEQAIATMHAPAGSVMLAASSVDSMLKAKGYKDGSLYSRIDKASNEHLITEDMAKWAHAVRLEANDQRHADEAATLPVEADARRCIDFASALGQFLFTLPERVKKGLAPPT